MIDRIGAALKRYCDVVNVTPGNVAKRVNVPTQYGWLLAAGRAVPADSLLRLAGTLSIDPDTGHPASPQTPPWRGPILWPFFATGLRGRLLIDRLTVRDAAQISGTSAATVCRASNGMVVNVSSFLRLSRFLRHHPNEWAVCADSPPAPKVFHEFSPLKQRIPA